MSSPKDLPERAQVVIVGGGVTGCSIAYHLAHLGWTDIVLLEQHELTAGTTWHAAGLMVTFGSTSETSTEMRKYTRDLYSRLEAETGQATGFAPIGFIEVASDKDRLEEYRRVSAFNRYCGVDVHEISGREVGEHGDRLDRQRARRGRRARPPRPPTVGRGVRGSRSRACVTRSRSRCGSASRRRSRA